MGCKNTTPAPQGTLLEQYHAAGLPEIWSGDVQNNFEKEIYMAINICRHDPKKFSYWVKMAYKDHVLLKGGLGKKQNELVAKLTSMEPLRAVKIDANATEAVRQNNTAAVEKEEAAPTKGGNIAKFSELSGGDKADSCYEFTMPGFEGQRGEEFVALQLALDFEGLNECTKKAAELKAATAATTTAATVDAPKTDDKLIEPAEPEAAANAMDAGSAPVTEKAEDKEVPKEEPKVEAAAAAEPSADKKPKDPKKQPAASATPGYSPVLDAEIETVGICMKPHKKVTNMIQVLYCKPTTNALA